jgi:Leucine-rich repeat (LRR) protein
MNNNWMEECIIKCFDNRYKHINGMKILDVGYGGLEEFPTGLDNDTLILICGNNELTYLPPLPRSLIQLNCENNKLKSLPILPFTLEYLHP